MQPPIVVLGGGVIGSSIAYHLALQGSPCVVVEEHRTAGCASGKAAGFLAGTWGDRSTAQLSRLSFDMHAELASTLELKSYRRLPTLEVRRRGDDGYSDSEGEGEDEGEGEGDGGTRVSWLDGAAEAEASLIDADTAQVCPAELSAAMLEAATARGATVLIDEAVGLEFTPLGEEECEEEGPRGTNPNPNPNPYPNPDPGHTPGPNPNPSPNLHPDPDPTPDPGPDPNPKSNPSPNLNPNANPTSPNPNPNLIPNP